MIRKTTKNQKRPSFKLLAYGVICALLASAMAYAAFSTIHKPTPTPNGCYEGFITRDRMILVDSSIPRWNDEQQRALRTALEREFDGLAFNERLSIITTEGDVVSDIPVPRLQICGIAQDPADLESIGAAPVTAAYLRKAREKLFREKVQPELEKILAQVPDKTREQAYQSPLLELLQGVSKSGLVTEGARVVLISDLIQNSDSARFCTVKGDLPPFARFKTRPAYRRTQAAPMPGAEFEILMLQRRGYGQSTFPYCTEDELAQFWQAYFEDLQATVQLTRIRDGFVGG